MERISVLDASLLDLETPVVPLHTGGLSVFAPGLTFAAVHETLRDRLELIPHGRKRLQPVPLGRPVWVDDTDFDLSYHLRHAALPTPGDRGQLSEFVSRLIGRQLDRSRPLWELYVIEGLEGGHTALFRKVHLVMGGGNMPDPFSALLDDTPEAVPAARADRWKPGSPPSAVRLTADALRERAEQFTDLGRGMREIVRAPGKLARTAQEVAGSALGMAARVARHAPPSPLNRRLSPHRRFVTTAVDLEGLRQVRRAFGCTINDILVAVAGDALGSLLRWRGYETKDLDLQVMVPVRVHGPEGDALPSAQAIGDGAVGVLAPLPVMEMDPVARLFRIMGELAGLKESRQAVAADALVRLAGYAPPNLHATAARLVSAAERYNLALSNAPGPQTPRYLRGVEMVESYPYISLAGDCALSIAVSSYAGRVFFGLLGDRDGMPDLGELSDFLDDALAQLVAAAGES